MEIMNNIYGSYTDGPLAPGMMAGYKSSIGIAGGFMTRLTQSKQSWQERS